MSAKDIIQGGETAKQEYIMFPNNILSIVFYFKGESDA
jgi:hypothetical protein